MDGIGKKVILEYRWYLVEFFVSRNSFKKFTLFMLSLVVNMMQETVVLKHK